MDELSGCCVSNLADNHDAQGNHNAVCHRCHLQAPVWPHGLAHTTSGHFHGKIKARAPLDRNYQVCGGLNLAQAGRTWHLARNNQRSQ
tara:strand:+ start:17906 stop:18169 length:264 start_codon:yes stop_codon:yes gene_type:complete